MGLKKFIKNIYFLQKYSLEKEFQKSRDMLNLDVISDIIQNEKYGINIPEIVDIESTIKKICSEKFSLARFGDGEFMLIEGKDIPFQKSSEKISARLKEILSSNNPQIGIGIPYALYSVKNKRTENSKKFWRQNGPHFRELLRRYLNMESVYYPAEVTLFPTYSVETEKFNDYFQNIRQIWQDKDIHLIHGKGIFDHFEFDIFDNAKTVTHQEAPSQNAFEEYDSILAETLKVNPNKLIIIILGPTAAILAYDLALKGYQALDFGHIAKTYDWWKKGKTSFNQSEINSFFKPD